MPKSSASARPMDDPSRVLLITGASRGIGASTALLAAAQGWDVAVNYARDQAAADQLVTQIRSLGRRALAVQADVADPVQVERLFAAVDAGLGPLQGLVNNAGVVDVAARVDEMSPARLQRMFAINVFGSFYCCTQAVRRMSTRHGGVGGTIVNVSSGASRSGGGGQYVDYAAAKGAIDTLTIGLAREVVQEGIRVNAVRPGVTETDIHASGGEPDRAQRLASQIPLGRPGRPEEIAEAIVWLLSPASSYCIGSFIDATGGR